MDPSRARLPSSVSSTCRGYVQNVLAKLGVHTQLEAVVKATGLGMLRGGGTPAGQPAGDRARR